MPYKNQQIEKPQGPIHLQEGPEHRTRLIQGFPKMTPEEASKEPMWTPEDVAKYMNVNVTTVIKWSMKRMIPAYRIGNTLRYRIEEILAIAKANIENHQNTRPVKKDQAGIANENGGHKEGEEETEAC